ncbi:solute carrier family 13 (sodium-dependent dicarboxylate transporter), member 2/3/5 [Belliella buryatensis]|uniref:Solute carrier family 13 (Sodium-dependent dicarboxylate transporter), member 2/3/5 n=1 Tax=Belliella buryatensis TaxID=1500549 RepID=A0A239EWK4_9BACT|nr:SLC13 family permease [Belliella buryatensis]SNS48967.1 solute carrier family 13 (sodium-dependent dicarboxylate transporter), member 2/3/5 [Belliella buryatensis]
MDEAFKNSKSISFGLFLGPIVFLSILFFYKPADLSFNGLFILSLTAWIAIWWITEAIPIAATALLPLVFLPLANVLSIAETAKSYSHPMVLLYMGGFMIAMAIEKWKLHKRIALTIINWIGLNIKLIILGFMIATAFLSMWISNTATSLMMLPIAIAVTSQLDPNQNIDSQIGKALMLGVAYSASIGGLATLIGTPTNIILASVIQELFQVEISFSQWMTFGLPISIVLLFICWFYLTRFAFSFSQIYSEEFAKDEIKKQLIDLGSISKAEKRVGLIFGLVSIAWISRSGFLDKLLPFLDDTIIALSGVLLLFLIPSGKGTYKLLDWKTAEKIPWGILILFGGGLSLAEGFKTSGLAEWIGNQFVTLEYIGFGLFLLIVILAVNFLTEITSNMATASMLLPILAAVSFSMDVHPFGLMIGATMASSCAFMLPVATPPNAVVFGSGYLRMRDMVKAGLWMNIISVILIALFTYFLLPIIWSIDLKSYPF